MVRQALLGMDLQALQQVAAEAGLPRYAARQLAHWLYVKHVTSVDEMTNLPKTGRERLKERYEVGGMEPVKCVTSTDGTVKYLFPTSRDCYVETVLIPECGRGGPMMQTGRSLDEPKHFAITAVPRERRTVCVSTQVGCRMNCLFCQTGKQGFQGNLTAGDILSQVRWAVLEGGVDNVVVMGQGEPLDNLDELLRALQVMTADWGYGWSPRRITVSTVGLRKGLQRFVEESECHLAVSLHSGVPEVRRELMPAERQMSIAEVVALLRRYDFSHQRRLSFEYLMLRGRNDSMEDARTVLRLLRGMSCRVNLIRWHHVPGVPLEGTDEAGVLAFRDYLTRHGLFTTIRASRGEDIQAACGMLITSQRKEKSKN